MTQVAIITGGASGMGLAVAKALSEKEWTIHLFDLNDNTGRNVEKELENTTYHKVDVSSYDSLASAFHAVFKKEGQLDFVWANAGIFEYSNYYAKTTQLPPPPPDEHCLGVNLGGVVKTSWLAQKYFEASPHHGNGAVLLMTASVSAMYATEYSPLYAASKAGILNFMRSVAGQLYSSSGIRTCCICPGGVRTPLLSDEVWSKISEENLTPMSSIVSAVEMLIKGGAMTDSKGKEVEATQDHGVTVEVNLKNFYFREQPEFGDEQLARTMGRTTASNMEGSHTKHLLPK